MAPQLGPAHRACFEAGIKLGSLYHQFAGTPLSPSSAASLEQAIEESIENQPFCQSVDVQIDRERLDGALDDRFEYTEFTGRLFECHLTVEQAGLRVEAVLEEVDGYPLMSLETIESIE